MEDLRERFTNDDGNRIQEDLRQQISALLLDRSEMVAADTVPAFLHGGSEGQDAAHSTRVGQMLAQLLGFAVRDGRIEPRSGFVADLHRVAQERGVSIDRLFTFVYLTERTALDELALDEDIGATSEAWPLVVQLVRRASFDVLAAHSERTQLEPGGATITDRLTTLHSRPLLELVLAKEIDRASRLGYPLSFILFDVDRLSAINEEHGYGVGDRILERLGILIRGFFRQGDWIARHSEDAIAVLLTGPDAAHANDLAERVRATVEERLEFLDHRTERPVRVTLTAAVVNAQAAGGDALDAERLMADAEAAMDRAKRQGRNRVEIVDSR
jgi:diguanylate cyclase (GGDEF)-like protein